VKKKGNQGAKDAGRATCIFLEPRKISEREEKGKDYEPPSREVLHHAEKEIWVAVTCEEKTRLAPRRKEKAGG